MRFFEIRRGAMCLLLARLRGWAAFVWGMRRAEMWCEGEWRCGGRVQSKSESRQEGAARLWGEAGAVSVAGVGDGIGSGLRKSRSGSCSVRWSLAGVPCEMYAYMSGWAFTRRKVRLRSTLVTLDARLLSFWGARSSRE